MSGIPFGVVMAVVGILDGEPVVVSVVAAAAGGVFFGAFMGAFQARMNRRTKAAIDDVPADRLPALYRSAMRGALPEDPDVRAAAVRLVAHDLERSRRTLKWGMVVLGAFLLLTVWLAVTSSPRWWGGVVFWGCFMAFSVWVPFRLRRRLALLRDADA